MSPGAYVYHNTRHHPCFSVASEDMDRVLELLRVKGIAAEVRAVIGSLAEFEFFDQPPSRVSLLLEELWKYG